MAIPAEAIYIRVRVETSLFAAALYNRMLLQASMETSGMAAWRSDMKWTDDEDDHDSDTDSKLSGSAIVDSVM